MNLAAPKYVRASVFIIDIGFEHLISVFYSPPSRACDSWMGPSTGLRFALSNLAAMQFRQHARVVPGQRFCARTLSHGGTACDTAIDLSHTISPSPLHPRRPGRPITKMGYKWVTLPPKNFLTACLPAWTNPSAGGRRRPRRAFPRTTTPPSSHPDHLTTHPI